MDWTQLAYSALLLAAIVLGRPDWRLSAICVGNFIGTMELSPSLLSVGVLDAVTVAALIYVGTWRGNALAFIFAILIPWYVFGAYFSWTTSTTYTIVDMFGFVSIPGVLASGSGGGIRGWRGAAGRKHSGAHSTLS